MTVVYGIKNCDTIKKAKKWLEANHIDYVFHDYKTQSVEIPFLQEMIAQHGLDMVINKRGTTYRKLSNDEKQMLNAENAPTVLQQNPSMIKRPILERDGQSWIGFNADEYASIFA